MQRSTHEKDGIAEGSAFFALHRALEVRLNHQLNWKEALVAQKSFKQQLSSPKFCLSALIFFHTPRVLYTGFGS